MHRIHMLEPEFAASFPQPMNPGVLYVSIPYLICGHLCCCGCGEEVITPLSPAQWSLTYNGDSVSLISRQLVTQLQFALLDPQRARPLEPQVHAR